MDRAYAALNLREVSDGGDGFVVIKGIASTPTTDRQGDIVNPLGAKFRTPMPLLWQHDSRQPIGQVTFAKPTKSGIPFEARIPLVKEAGRLKDRIDEAVQSLRHALVGFVSIGFRGIAEAMKRIETGWQFDEWEWLELSIVTIPAQPEAVITSVKSITGEQPAPLSAELISQIKSADEAIRRTASGAQAGGRVVRLDIAGSPGTVPGASGQQSTRRKDVVYLN